MGRYFQTIKANNNTTGRIIKMAKTKKIDGAEYSLVKSEKMSHPFFNHEMNMAEANRLYPEGVKFEKRGNWIFYYAKGKSIYQQG